MRISAHIYVDDSTVRTRCPPPPHCERFVLNVRAVGFRTHDERDSANISIGRGSNFCFGIFACAFSSGRGTQNAPSGQKEVDRFALAKINELMCSIKSFYLRPSDLHNLCRLYCLDVVGSAKLCSEKILRLSPDKKRNIHIPPALWASRWFGSSYW